MRCVIPAESVVLNVLVPPRVHDILDYNSPNVMIQNEKVDDNDKDGHDVRNVQDWLTLECCS